MFLLKSVLCSLFALSSVSSVNAWDLSEPEVNRVVRGEAEKQARTALVQHYQATGHVKSNFRLESSYSALKEARKSMLWFILAYPALAAVFYQFDTQKGMTYFSYMPHLVAGLCAIWGMENILRGQVELNKEQYAQASALNK